MESGQQDVLISSACPSVNLLIRKHFPTLVPYLMPVVTPMEAHALQIRQRDPGARVVYIGPCIAAKDTAQRFPGTVDAVCELARRKGIPASSCKGYDSRAFSKWAKTIVTRADGVDLRSFNDKTFQGINADAAKEQVQLAFLALPLLPGSMSLFGDDPLNHWDFAEEITNETLTDRIQGTDCVFYNWTLKPGAPNHFLDALGICIAAAKWFRFWTSDDVIESAGGTTPSIRPVAKKTRKPKIVVRR